MSPTRQLDLFGEPLGPRERRTAGIGMAAVPERLQRVAEQLPDGLYMGTSSWSFPGWNGLVYDRKAAKGRLAREGLAAYGRHPLLRAVGIDRTFYAPVTAAELEVYAEAVPDDFRFLVKASSACTTPYRRDARGRPCGNNERFLDPSYATAEVVGPFVEGLGNKAGPLVFQFSPVGSALRNDPARFADSVAGFLEALPRGPLYAVELRDPELLCSRYVAALASVGARHCLGIHPRMPGLEEQAAMTASLPDGPLIVRWMLHTGLDYEAATQRYDPFDRLVDEDLPNRTRLADLCLDMLERGQQIVIVANNKAEGSAPLTVFRLAEEIAGRLSGPPPATPGPTTS